jgi:hypothetical protein
VDVDVAKIKVLDFAQLFRTAAETTTFAAENSDTFHHRSSVFRHLNGFIEPRISDE